MSGFVMRPRVFPTSSSSLSDTLRACRESKRPHSAYKYAHGQIKPHFPVPVAIENVVHTGYVHSGIGAMAGVSYIWVSSIRRLWTFWHKIGLVEEWIERNGGHIARRSRRYV